MAQNARQIAKNVLGTPLQVCSINPITGWYRDGYCNTDPSDLGEHTVAAVMSDPFLAYSASRGNDLSTTNSYFPGLREGCKWCLCLSRWKEAFTAYTRGEIGQECVPRVVLASTHSSALRGVPLQDFARFAVDRHLISSDPDAVPSGSGGEGRH